MIVAVHTPPSHISLRRKSLLITTADGEETSVPIDEIERLLIGSRVSVTSPCLALLLGKRIPVVLISTSGRHLGSFEPPSPSRGLTRRLAHQRTKELPFRSAIASALISAKIQNCHRALQRLNNRKTLFDKNILTQFKHLIHQVGYAESIDVLRGLEGAAAARYFAIWAEFLPDSYPFCRRSTRPPLNPVNAVISFTSSLVHGEILSALLNRGLDTTTGFLHETTDDRHALVLDLMEPYRPALIEPLTLRMFNLGILSGKHFKPHGKGTYLNETGRTLLLEQYEDRLGRRFIDPRSSQRTTLRTCLQMSALELKSALTEPSGFQPFLLP